MCGPLLRSFPLPRVPWLFAATITLLGAMLLRATPAAADDVRTVGPYRIAVSFASTPVYPEESNALVIRVTDATGAPVTGLESALRLHIGVKNQVTETWNLEPVPAEPGTYRVILVLPRAGTYGMSLFGTLNGQPIDERYVTGDNGLDKVIAHGRSYPRGAGFIVLLTFGSYLLGLAILVGRAALARRRRLHRPAT